MSTQSVILTILAPLVALCQISCYPADLLEPLEPMPEIRHDPCRQTDSLAWPIDSFSGQTEELDVDVDAKDEPMTLDEWESGLEYDLEEEDMLESEGDTDCVEVAKIESGVGDTLARSAQVYTFALSQNYPNPFNPATTIFLTLPIAVAWKLTVMNPLGQVVQVMRDSGPGTIEIGWDASGRASGVYLYRVEAAEFCETRKMLLLK